MPSHLMRSTYQSEPLPTQVDQQYTCIHLVWPNIYSFCFVHCFDPKYEISVAVLYSKMFIYWVYYSVLIMHILFTIHLALLILVGFCGEQERWVGLASQLERVQGFLVEQSANSSCRESDKVLPDLKCTTCNSTHPSLCLGIYALGWIQKVVISFKVSSIGMTRCAFISVFMSLVTPNYCDLLLLLVSW